MTKLIANNILVGDLFGLGYIFPGLHIKSFFLLFVHNNIKTIIISYIALFLPSVLFIYVTTCYYEQFNSVTWKGISTSVQTVSNGLILVTIASLISEESCHFNIVLYTSIVLFTVTKLYKLN